jgi:hypothetical protein
MIKGYVTVQYAPMVDFVNSCLPFTCLPILERLLKPEIFLPDFVSDKIA